LTVMFATTAAKTMAMPMRENARGAAVVRAG
jgi:hypothetical protein